MTDVRRGRTSTAPAPAGAAPSDAHRATTAGTQWLRPGLDCQPVTEGKP